MAGWNLGLRFVLELAALVGLGALGWQAFDDPVRWVFVIALPLVAAVVWGRFAVPGDPSRSGKAPTPVPGWVRLLIELAVFGAGAVGIYAAFGAVWAIVFVVVTLAHYAVGWERIRWLLATHTES